LARQYWRYGQGRAYTTWKHKRFSSWRQLAAPVLVVGLVVSLVAGIVWQPFILVFPLVYGGGLLGVALLSWPGEKIGIRIRLLVAAAWLVMHVCWGFGFISNFTRLALRSIFRKG